MTTEDDEFTRDDACERRIFLFVVGRFVWLLLLCFQVRCHR